MPEVARQPTPLSPLQMAAPDGPFVQGHCRVAGRPPTITFLRNCLAIIGVENANGRAINNNNWGNVMAGPSWRESGRDYWAHPKPQAGQPAFFRAYKTSVAGAERFWRTLYARPTVLQWANTGDTKRMVRELYATAYVVAASKNEQQHYTDAAINYVRQYNSVALFRTGPEGNPDPVFNLTSASVVRFDPSLPRSFAGGATAVLAGVAAVGATLAIRRRYR